MARIVEIDPAFSEHLIALARVPMEIPNICEQPLEVLFRHSDASPKRDRDTQSASAEVRYGVAKGYPGLSCHPFCMALDRVLFGRQALLRSHLNGAYIHMYFA